MSCLEEGEFIDDTSPEIITLDSTQELLNDTIELEVNEEKKVIKEIINPNDNPEFLEQTLPPGVAPDGFILLDESVATENNKSVVIEDDKPKKLKSEEKEDTPIFKVIFKNELIADKYRKRVCDFFKRLIGQTTLKQDDENLSKCILNFWGDADVISESSSKKIHVNGFEGEVLFTIDSEPDAITDSLSIPTYGKRFEKILREDMDANEEEKNEINTAPKLNCFNCLGNHNMRDCTEPRNPIEINKNRKEFGSRNGPRNVRYHVDDEQKYGHLKPGVLSLELRKALGLSDDQLPRHIFRMRNLGYPPGWLEEARLEHSGMILYNSDGKSESDPSIEKNKISQNPENNDKYDIKKLHDFPGFNVPPPPGTHDSFWHPELQAIHSKEAMLENLSGRHAEDGYKRKKMRLSAPLADNNLINSCIEPVEMEIVAHDTPTSPEKLFINENNNLSSPASPDTTEENSLPPGVEKELIDTSIEIQNEIPSTPIIDKRKNILDISGIEGSPSLLELENKKKLLLEALDDSSLQSNPATPVRLNLTSEEIKPTTKCGTVKSVEFGTPIIQSTSPFTTLPSSDKFSKNICDVINFENLPDSTGKYEKIAGILQKVRVVLANNENDD